MVPGHISHPITPVMFYSAFWESERKPQLSSFGDFTSKTTQVHMDCITLHLSRQNHHLLVKLCDSNYKKKKENKPALFVTWPRYSIYSYKTKFCHYFKTSSRFIPHILSGTYPKHFPRLICTPSLSFVKYRLPLLYLHCMTSKLLMPR